MSECRERVGLFVFKATLVVEARRLMVVIQIDDRLDANTTFLHIDGLNMVGGRSAYHSDMSDHHTR